MATIRKRGNSYQIRVSAGYDIKGKQIMHTMTWTPDEKMTEKQVEKELNKQAVLFEERCAKNNVAAKRVKFEEFAERWFTEYAEGNLKSTSYQRMKCASKRVYAALGHMWLDKITRAQIQKFIDNLATNCKTETTNVPLSRKTVIHHLGFLSDVFTYAVRMDILPENPCHDIIIPKCKPKKEKEIYTVAEVKELMIRLESAPVKYRAFFMLAIYSGFRRGELLGLEWKDVDWENEIISIRRTSYYLSTKGTFTDTPKTQKSQRSLKLPTKIFEILQELRAENLKLKKAVGKNWVDSDRLFISQNGSPMSTHNPYNWLRNYCRRNNFRFCDIHSLRHRNNTKTHLSQTAFFKQISPCKNNRGNA